MTGPAAPAAMATAPIEATPSRRRRRLRVIAGIVGIALLVAVAVAVWWLQPQPLLPEAAAAMASTEGVAFTQERGWLEYRPTDAEPSVGLILYPGGKVEPAGYARSAQAIAEQGYLVVIVPMPLNLAVLGADSATDVIAAHPGIDTWAIGGHSLGGAMAGQYADRHPDAIAGLALWAAFPNGDLSDQPALAAVSVYGSLDAGAVRFGSADTMADMPPGSRFEVIEGGNHEQMGDYTGQPNDPPAAISRDDQQVRVQGLTLDLLAGIAAAP